MSQLLMSLLRAAALLGACAFLSGCAVNPVTGETELSLVSRSQEIEMGREASLQVDRDIGLVDNEALQSYVNTTGQKLAALSERPDLPWQFQVVDDPTPNAFALPGGFIYVTRGMLALMTSEAQLAAVLGHEIGHVSARHSVQQITRSQLAQLGLGIGVAAVPELQGLQGLLGTGMQLLMLKYSRDAERQADQLGFRYALEAGYDVRQMEDVFKALQRSAQIEGSSPLPGWLSTHPGETERIAAVEARLAGLPAARRDSGTVGRDGYLDHLEGLAYGENPRNGFFRDGMFYHPELDFSFRVPTGWQTENLPRMVRAVSPQQDAALQLTMVSDTGIEAASLRFFSDSTVTATGPGVQQVIHGAPAIVAGFTASGESGALEGSVAHIAHGGAVYRLVVYAASASISRYQALFREIIGSFMPLQDRALLNTRARRLHIVRPEQAMTFRSFALRYPSGIPLEELALINQVSDPATATVPAGEALKQVQGEGQPGK